RSRSPGVALCILLGVAIWLVRSGSGTGAPAGPTITPQSSPIALSADNKRLVNVNPDASSVSIFDVTVSPPAKLAEVAVGTDPVSVAIVGSKAYVANSASASVSVVDLGTQAVVKTIAVGVEPMGVCAAPNGTRVYVANAASNSLSVI